MNIESISATNYKNLALDQVPLQPVTLVMGENGVGKSNLLQLIHILFQKKEPIEGAGVQFPLDGLVADDDLIRRGKTDGEASVLVTTDSDVFRAAWRAFPNFPEPYTKKVTLKFRFWREVKGTAFKLSDLTFGSTHVHGEKEKEPKIPEEALRKVQDWLEQELRDCTVYIPTNRLPSRTSVPYSSQAKVTAVTNLENTILRLLSDPHANQAEMDAIQDTLSTFFGIVDIRSTLGMKQLTPGETFLPPPGMSPDGQDPQSVSDIKVGVRVREKNKEWFELDKVGSGLQQVLVIITMLIQNRARIALLEEFDSSLSPSRRSDMLEHLIRLTGRKKVISQLITTTHGAFRYPNPRPLGLGPAPLANGTVDFFPVNKKFWKQHTLVDTKF